MRQIQKKMHYTRSFNGLPNTAYDLRSRRHSDSRYLAAAMPATQPSAAAPRVPTYRRLNTLGPLGVRREACLHLHKPFLDCHRCADACPRGCLKLTDGGIEFDPTACTGCGQCAAQCPSEALAVDGFTCVARATAGPLRIACRRAAIDDDGECWRVPCLGGLDPAALVSLAARRQTPLLLLDDGACAACPDAHNRENPVRPTLALARALLQSAALPAAWLPAIEARLPNGNGTKPPQDTGPSPNRRAFFSGLGRAASAAAVKKAGAAAVGLDLAALPAQPREAIPYQRGYRLRDALARLAETQGVGSPAQEWRAEVRVTGNCQAHGTCARLCPTGALALQRDQATSTLSFDAWLCIDCAACEKACPSKALSYRPPQWRPFLGSARQEVSRVLEHVCERCGERFAAATGDLCSGCRKSEALASAGRALFGGFRHGRREAVGPP